MIAEARDLLPILIDYANRAQQIFDAFAEDEDADDHRPDMDVCTALVALQYPLEQVSGACGGRPEVFAEIGLEVTA